MTTWAQLVFNAAFVMVLCQFAFSTRTLLKFVKLYVSIATVLAGYGIIQSVLANGFGTMILFPYTWDILTHPLLGAPGYQDSINMLRATSLLPEPRHFGNFLVTPIAIVMTCLVAPRKILFKHSLVPWVVLLVLGIGLLLSASGSALLAIFIGILFLPLVIIPKLKRSVKWIGAGSVGTGSVVAIGMFFSLDMVTHTVSRVTLSRYEVQHLFDFNVQLWGAASYLRGSYLVVQQAFYHPLFGVGLNQRDAFLNVAVEVNVLPPSLLLASIGFVGFGAFVGFLVATFTQSFRLRGHLFDYHSIEYWLLTISLVLVTLVVVKSTFGSKFNYPDTWFWFDIGIALVIYYTVRESVFEASGSVSKTRRESREP